MDWSDIRYFIDEAVGHAKMPTRQALEALDSLKHEINARMIALRQEMGTEGNLRKKKGLSH
jgi:hypothetical protein